MRRSRGENLLLLRVRTSPLGRQERTLLAVLRRVHQLPALFQEAQEGTHRIRRRLRETVSQSGRAERLDKHVSPRGMKVWRCSQSTARLTKLNINPSMKRAGPGNDKRVFGNRKIQATI